VSARHSTGPRGIGRQGAAVEARAPQPNRPAEQPKRPFCSTPGARTLKTLAAREFVTQK
jgi:hypothetical protein